MLIDRRIVVRDTLTELETAVIELESDGWELDPSVPNEKSQTVLAALRNSRIQGMTAGITVPMRKLRNT